MSTLTCTSLVWWSYEETTTHGSCGGNSVGKRTKSKSFWASLIQCSAEWLDCYPVKWMCWASEPRPEKCPVFLCGLGQWVCMGGLWHKCHVCHGWNWDKKKYVSYYMTVVSDCHSLEILGSGHISITDGYMVLSLCSYPVLVHCERSQDEQKTWCEIWYKDVQIYENCTEAHEVQLCRYQASHVSTQWLLYS